MGTRDQIVDAANRLFYEQGFEPTSFASIADAVGISRGNFYYHFKTKDEILAAVIDARLASTREMLACWNEHATSPLERVCRFVEIVMTNREDIEDYGCPVGTLTSDLAKLEHPLRAQWCATLQKWDSAIFFCRHFSQLPSVGNRQQVAIRSFNWMFAGIH